MGLHFIFHGARHEQPGVIASLQENRTQIERIARGFGWSVNEPHVEGMYRSPVDIYIDESAHELMQAVERTGARRGTFDSLNPGVCGFQIRARPHTPAITRFLIGP